MHTDILTTNQLAVLDGLKAIPAVHELPFDWNDTKRFFTAEATRLLAAETGERP